MYLLISAIAVALCFSVHVRGDEVSREELFVQPHVGSWQRKLTIYSPSNAKDHVQKLPVVLYFHAGGFFSDAIGENWCMNMSTKLGAFVVAPNYRLAPEYELPAAYKDSYMALLYLERLPQLASANLSRVYIAGASAGGNIAHHITLEVAKRKWTNDFHFKLGGQILIQPFFGGEARSHSEVKFGNSTSSLSLANTDSLWLMALPFGATRDHPFANPAVMFPCELLEVKHDYVSKTLVVIGGKDLLKDRQLKFVRTINNAGVYVKSKVYKDAFHGIQDTDGPVMVDLLDEIVSFCDS